jgi:hypothetical protein
MENKLIGIFRECQVWLKAYEKTDAANQDRCLEKHAAYEDFIEFYTYNCPPKDSNSAKNKATQLIDAVLHLYNKDKSNEEVA